ncbi:hypothetical protein GCM10014713_36110 [Streptomyces purpureus]|uniref:Uncharacterized protein n=1 Tax=Streptomyces purpureus TaxID=1951 RepID=A0A918H5V4_9ACTN|nr:hypothetical protein GCM10014713_36110 [Streptomyces purpureus]
MARVGDLRGSFLRVTDLVFWRLVAMGCDGLERVSCGLCADWLRGGVRVSPRLPQSPVEDDIDGSITSLCPGCRVQTLLQDAWCRARGNGVTVDTRRI